MGSLLNFLVRFSSWFVFLIYVLLSCVLLFGSNDYQRSVYLTSANSLTAGTYETVADVKNYFALKRINEGLVDANAALLNEVLNLKDELATLKAEVGDSTYSPRFEYVTAKVINNSTRRPNNYITIQRGSDDGVERGMGVVGNEGIVGIVNAVGSRTARVSSVLNEGQHYSVKLKDTPYVGSLIWKSGDPTVAYMTEVARHAKWHRGDSVVTSGYSTTFPEGIPVGVVVARVKGADDNFFTLRVKLASDFDRLGSVRVIKDELKSELDSLESFDLPEKTSVIR